MTGASNSMLKSARKHKLDLKSRIFKHVYSWRTHYKLNWGNNKSIIVPILIIVGIFIAVYSLLFISLNEPLGLSKKTKVNGWSDRYSLSLSLVTLLAPIAITIGYFLAIRRTQAVFKQNELSEIKLEDSHLSQGIEMLTSNAPLKQLAGIALLKRIGIASYQTGEGPNFPVLNHVAENGEFSDIVRCAALRSCLVLAHQSIDLHGPRHRVRLDDANFDVSELKIEGKLSRIFFVNCTKLPRQFTAITFDGALFNHCVFSQTRFSRVKFINVNFSKCQLDQVFLEDCEFINVEGWDTTSFAECSYHIERPPTGLAASAILGPPAKLSNGAYEIQNKRQAEAFRSQNGNDKFRPRDRDGNLIEIVYPDEE